MARRAPRGVADRVADLARLRLGTGIALIVIGLVGLFGGDWDIQWHAVIGRDRTFTPPHDLILLGIGAAGIVALASILIESAWATRQPELRPYGTEFLGVLHSSLGSYLVGFGAVCSAVAFPLDTYWHALYGVDVSLWAPFHTMIYLGGILSSFGAIYLLLSAAHLARHKSMTVTLSYAGVVVLLGMLLTKLCTFLMPALSGHALHLGAVTISLFPLLLALVAVFVAVLAVRVLPWPGAATLVVLVFVALWLLIGALVPPAMTALVAAEHQTYLARASRLGGVVVPLLGQTPLLLLLALALDGVAWFGRRGAWSPTRRKQWGLAAASLSMVVVGGLTLLLTALRVAGAAAGAGGTAGGEHGLLGFVLALVLVVPGCLVGGALGLAIGDALAAQRR
jgi:hypothetical protein